MAVMPACAPAALPAERACSSVVRSKWSTIIYSNLVSCSSKARLVTTPLGTPAALP